MTTSSVPSSVWRKTGVVYESQFSPLAAVVRGVRHTSSPVFLSWATT